MRPVDLRRLAPRSALVAIAAAAAAPMTACDPCAGVIACRSAPRIGVSGQIVDGEIRDAQRGPPGVGGVRVVVTPTGGVEVGAASASATSDGSGWWSVELTARDAGDATVDVAVTPPAPGLPYTVRGLGVRASRTRGDGSVLGRWVSRPRITLLGTIADRRTGAGVPGALVTIVRRGGVEVRNTPSTQNPISTSSLGYFLYDVQPLTYGPLVADLLVERAGRNPVVVPGVSILPEYEWTPPRPTGAYTFLIDDLPSAARGPAADPDGAAEPRGR